MVSEENHGETDLVTPQNLCPSVFICGSCLNESALERVPILSRLPNSPVAMRRKPVKKSLVKARKIRKNTTAISNPHLQQKDKIIMRLKTVSRLHLAFAPALLACCALRFTLSMAQAQGTAFTYQGHLTVAGSPANGNYDLEFSLFDAPTNGARIGGAVTNLDIGVTNGLFTTTMDFGPGIFTGESLWLQIGVESNGGGGSFTLLSALQPLTPTPYAIYGETSGTANSAYTVSAGGVLANSLSTPVFPGTGQVLAFNGSGLVWSNVTSPGGGANGWLLTGNAGTTAGPDFLGTTDNQPLEIHVNDMRGMRVEPTVNDANHTGIVNVVNGASINFAAPGVYGATISGGGAANYFSPPGTNSVGADFGTVGGGIGNSAGGQYSTVVGGFSNTAAVLSSFIGGGTYNVTAGPGYATVVGGYDNTAGAELSAVVGGTFNQATGNGSFVGGGGFDGVNYTGNRATGAASTVAGGLANEAVNSYATVAGGTGNYASGIGSFIGGGGYDGGTFSGNVAAGAASTVGGGLGNVANNQYATVAGGVSNTVDGAGAFVGGGGYDGSGYGANSAAAGSATVAGGLGNSITLTGYYSTIGGGSDNSIVEPNSFIGGGSHNNCTGGISVIAGGADNSVPGVYATIGGGSGNQNSGQYGTIGGGAGNVITDFGEYATIPGGNNNSAAGQSSFAAGQNAAANDDNSFVWGDGTRQASSQGVDSFAALATGGVWFYTATNSNAGAKLAPGATSWTTISDRNAKKNFQDVDTVGVLEKLAAIPVQRWNYKWEKDSDVPNIGPMAQDFKGAFYPGRDDKSISTLEFDGVELAAIQGLNEKLKQKDAEIADLKARLDRLEKLLEK
jgi:trimeric autotransporter adhesin